MRFAAVSFASLVAVAAAESANPIRRVVTLLQDMQKEIEMEGQKEEKLYNKFMCFCKGNTDSLDKAAADAAAKIEQLTAKKKADEAEKAQLQQDLVQHKQDRQSAKQDLATATKLREKEHKQYTQEAGDTKANIDALQGAIPALEKGMGSSFIQSAAAAKLKQVITGFADAAASPADREAVLSFLSESGDYVPASGQIVGILKNMKDEMDKALGGIISDEEQAVKSFGDLSAAKKKEIATASAAIESKQVRAGELAVSVVQTKDSLEDATAELSDAQKFQAELTVACKEKTGEWEERTATRNQEVSAISEAIKVLNDDDALDIFKQTMPTPPVPAQMAFLQRSTKKNAAAKAVEKAVLVVKAQKFSNPALNLLASAAVSKMRGALVQGKQDFSVVIKMIDDMVALLKKEQKDDETHKEWCGAEFETNDDETKDTVAKLASVESSISELKDSIAAMKDAIAQTNDKVKALDQSVAEATAQRKAEHSDFTQSAQLNEAAVQLIGKAKNKLQKFYNPAMYKAPEKRDPTDEEQAIMAAGGKVDLTVPAKIIAGTQQTVFVQLHQHTKGKSAVAPPVPPETFGAYANKGQKSNSVMALMDMLTKDLEKDMQESEHNEKTAQKEYEQLLADAQETRAQDVKTITTNENSKAELEGELDQAKTQQIMAKDQKKQLESYLADLHSSCDFVVANFEVRKSARSTEIDSLANAKAVLNGASYQ